MIGTSFGLAAGVVVRGPLLPEPVEVITGPMWLTALQTLSRIADLGKREGVTFCLENLNTAVDHPGTPFAKAADMGIAGYVDSWKPDDVQAAIEVALKRHRELDGAGPRGRPIEQHDSSFDCERFLRRDVHRSRIIELHHRPVCGRYRR